MSDDIFEPDLCVVMGVTYRPVAISNPRDCTNCAFNGPYRQSACRQAPCVPTQRPDGKYVHFIRADQ